MSPPKRDKFAAMAANMGSTPPPAATPAPAQPTTAAAPVTAGRDKLAAMSSNRQSKGKLAAMAAAAAATNPAAAQTATAPKPQLVNKIKAEGKLAAMSLKKQQQKAEQTQEALVRRTRQRDEVWEDLAKAEAATIRLLQLARDTSRTLAIATTGKKLPSASKSSKNKYNSNTDSSDNNSTNSDDSSEEDKDTTDPERKLRELSQEYAGTIGKIHGWLAPHSELIRPYQAPSRINRMYQARVEWRLAEEKRSVLKEFLRLDQLEAEEEGNCNQRRDDTDETSKSET